MKPIYVIACSVWLAISAFGQGTVYFNNFVAGVVSTRVYGPDPGNPLLIKTGNTAADFPAGTQTYGGPTLSGTSYTAQLWAAPGAGQPESSLIAITASTTSFRTGSAAGFVQPPGSTTAIPGAPEGTIATLQLRAWDNVAGTVLTWDDAIFSGAAKGRSPLFNSQPLGNTTTGARLSGLQSFNIAVPEPGTLTLGAIGAVLTYVCRRRARA
jgi:hypothetical protein